MRRGRPFAFILVSVTIWIGALPNATGQTRTVSGHVYESGSGERLQMVAVSLAGGTSGVLTNAYGFYSLRVPMADSVRIVFSAVGYQRVEKIVSGAGNQQLFVALSPLATQLGEVVVKGKKTDRATF